MLNLLKRHIVHRELWIFSCIALICMWISCERFEAVPVTLILTDTLTDVTNSQVLASGKLVYFDSDGVLNHGFCWAKSDNPDLDSDLHDSLGSTNEHGAFSSQISLLDPGTQYYFRAFATSSTDTVYGSVKMVTTASIGIPILITAEVHSITKTSAFSGGEVINDGGATVTERGICWSKQPAPDLSDAIETGGAGTGSFTSELTGLDCKTKYYVRAYATNSYGTGFGDERSFSTGICEGDLPSLTTRPIEYVSGDTASSGGNIIDDGGSAIIERGVCWSTSELPTNQDSITTDGPGSGIFTSKLHNLKAGTEYFVRAYATNAVGTNYGQQVSFTTLGVIKDYEGNEYNTIKIGEQTWMAENLRSKYYSSGSEIPLVENSWGDLTPPDKAYCYYENNTDNGNTYGLLYTWAAAMDGASGSDLNPSGVQGVCPTGWHLPSVAEWTVLFDTLGGISAAGGKLKETGTTHWTSPNTGGTNESGFRALPGGWRTSEGGFGSMGIHGYWWTSKEQGSFDAYFIWLYYNKSSGTIFNYSKTFGQAVRCVKDE